MGALLLLAGCGGVDGTSTSTTSTSTASNPVPSISSLSPSSIAAGSAAITLTVNGSDFVTGSVIEWNGSSIATSVAGSTSLSAVVPATDLATSGSASVTVVNPAPGGGTSSAATFSITATNPAPSVSFLSPSTVGAGSLPITLTVTGSDFVSGSTVDWNGAALTTTYVSATQLQATVPASDLATAGSFDVTVVSPAPGGGTSGASTFTVTTGNPEPSLTSISPISVAAGSTAFTLIVTGSGFVSGSTVDWNGTALTTTYVSASQLKAAVPASALTSAGTATVAVVSPTPGGGTSGAATFTINGTSSTAPSIRQSALYSAYPGDVSANWNVTLNDVQQGSTIYVIGVFPLYAALYADMAVSDGTNTYTQLDRYNDTSAVGTQAMVHWYAGNVKAGNYTINMAPKSAETYEDYVAVLAIEVAGTQASPLVGHAIHFQSNLAPGSDNINVSVTSTASDGLFIATAFDDVDNVSPTQPLLGPGLTAYSGNGGLWNPTGVGDAMGSGFRVISASGTQTATFSAEERAKNGVYPDYMTTGVIFH